MIPDRILDDVRARADAAIVEIIGRYVELKRSGQNHKGCCPFHGERTPSFNVNATRKSFKCFGCGKGGDAIQFVMEVDGLSFDEAVRKIGSIVGVSVPGESAGSSAQRSERDLAFALTRLATATWRAELAGVHGAAGRDYAARERGLTSASLDAFAIGYAPAPAEAGWSTLADAIRKSGLSLKLAEQLGLVGVSERNGQPFDRFRGRLVFPIAIPGGEVVAFSARTVPPHDADVDGKGAPPKYTNSPESVLYTKGKTLFGLAQAKPTLAATRRAVLVEGNLDVVRMHQWRHHETVAPLGTALTVDQARLLARFVDQVVIAFDGDNAGIKAADAALPLLLEAGLDVRAVALPAGTDPDSLGEARMAALLTAPRAALSLAIERAATVAGRSPDARARAAEALLGLVAKVPRPAQRDLYLDEIGSALGIAGSRLDTALRERAPVSAPPADRRSSARPPRPHPAQVLLTAALVDRPGALGLDALDLLTDPRLVSVAIAALSGKTSIDDLLAGVKVDRQEICDLVLGGQLAGVEVTDRALAGALLRSAIESLATTVVERAEAMLAREPAAMLSDLRALRTEIARHQRTLARTR